MIILKILAGLLLLLIGLSAVLLFVPVKYDVFASKKDTLIVDIKASWFLKIFLLWYKKTSKKSFMKFYIFGKLKGKGKKKAENKKEKKKEESKKMNYAKEGTKEETKEETDVNKNKEKDSDKSEIEVDESDVKKEGLTDKLEKAAALFKHPDRDELIRLTFRLCMELTISLKPSVFSLNAQLGTGDPAMTGYVLGFFESVKPFLGLNINVRGNFEKTELTGEVTVIGNIYIYKLLFPLIKYALTKPVWKLIKKYFFKKDDENEYKLEQQSERVI